MNRAKLNIILKNHRKWLLCKGGNRADLRNADLRGADLRGADLRGADLSYADLSYADLREELKNELSKYGKVFIYENCAEPMDEIHLIVKFPYKLERVEK